MRKKVSAFLMTVLAASTLAACGNDGEQETESTLEGTNEKTELDFCTPLSGGDGDFMRELVIQFNEQSEDTEVTLLNLTAEEYYTKLRTALTSNEAPEIAVAHSSRLAELQSDGIIKSIEDSARQADVDWESYTQNIVESTIVEGEHYAIPLDTHGLIMYLNTDILGEAGLMQGEDSVQIGTGSEEFLNFLEEIKLNTNEGVFPLSATSNGDSPMRIWWTLYSQLGGNLLNEEGTEATFNNEQGLEALNFMNQLMDKDYWPRNINNGGEMFTANNAAIHLNGVWMTGALEQNENLNFIAMPIPQIFEEQSTWGDSHTFVIPDKEDITVESEVAALEFADWIAENSLLWANAGHIPSKTDVVDSEEFQELAYRSDYAEIVDYVSYLPNNPQLISINEILIRNLDMFMNGQTDAQTTLDNMENEVNSQLN